MTSTALDPRALDILNAAPAAFRALLAGLPDAAVEAPGDEGWSPRDVIAHMQSTEGAAFHDRIEALAAGGRPAIANYDEQLELDRSGLRIRPAGELLDRFAELRAQSVATLRALDPAAYANSGDHATVGEISLADLIHHRSYHDTLHIAQVATLLGAPLDPLRGKLQAF
jgi:hypothetical protein